MTFQTPITSTALSINAADLRSVAPLLRRVRVRRNTIPILDTLRLCAEKNGETTTLTATDLDIEISATIPATSPGGLDACIPHGILFALATDARDTLDLALDGETLGLRADDISGHIKLLCPPCDFPMMDKASKVLANAEGITISEASLHRLLRLTSHCISSEQTRYYLNGVFLTHKPGANTLRAVATDGHRAAVIDDGAVRPESWPSIIIPRRSAAIMQAMCSETGNAEVTLTIADRYLRLTRGDVTMTTKLIYGTFPDYTRVVPTGPHENEAVLNRAGLARLVRTFAAIAGPSILPAITLDPDRNQIVMTQHSEGEVTAPLQGSGDTRIGFNGRYLMDQARVTPTFRVRYRGAGDPAIIEGGNSLESPEHGAFWILMPMRT